MTVANPFDLSSIYVFFTLTLSIDSEKLLFCFMHVKETTSADSVILSSFTDLKLSYIHEVMDSRHKLQSCSQYPISIFQTHFCFRAREENANDKAHQFVRTSSFYGVKNKGVMTAVASEFSLLNHQTATSWFIFKSKWSETCRVQGFWIAWQEHFSLKQK